MFVVYPGCVRHCAGYKEYKDELKKKIVPAFQNGLTEKEVTIKTNTYPKVLSEQDGRVELSPRRHSWEYMVPSGKASQRSCCLTGCSVTAQVETTFKQKTA